MRNQVTFSPYCRVRRICGAFALCLLACAALGVASAQEGPIGAYNPPRAGRAIYGSGGWMQPYTIAEVKASPEFSFPIQLIYQSDHESVGLFGPQFYCPQLESTVIPRGANLLVWTKPDGTQVGLQFDGKRNSTYRDYYGQWEAKAQGSHIFITNAKGWQYEYELGRLKGITSPSKRLLEFRRLGGSDISGIYIRDLQTNYNEPLIQFGYHGRRVSTLQVREQRHLFDYQGNRDERLSAWTLPTGRRLLFAYDQNNVLQSTQLENSKEKVLFRTEYVKPPREGAKPGVTPKNDPLNYWLVEDSEYTYKYGQRTPRDSTAWITTEISARTRAGVEMAVSGSQKRGTMTQKAAFEEYLAPAKGTPKKQVTTLQDETKYYYIAPGQKYDGMLRRMEKRGKLVADYHYDHKTGLLSETVDANDTVTAFEYDLKWKPKNNDHWEPQPVRITRKTRTGVEVIAEYGYDDGGKVAWSRDAKGDITRYGYNLRGELVQVIDPEGQSTTFTYDGLGRRIGITKGNQSERIAYDPMGHIQAAVSANGTRTDYAYDRMGNLAEVKQNGKPVMDYIRDGEGKISGLKDALGRVKKIQLDDKGHLLSETAPNGSVTRYEYDSLGHRIAQIDGNGNRITFGYDALGRLREQKNPIGNTLTWNYDTHDRLIEKGNGAQVIKYAYDPDGKLLSVDYGNPGEKVTYTYDNRDRIRTAATPTRSFTYYYDSVNRVEVLQIKEDGEELAMNYRYNARGQKTALILSSYVPAIPSKGYMPGKDAYYEFLHQTEYQYDPAGHLIAIKRNGQNLLTYDYDGAGRMASRTYANGMKAAVSYDAAGRLARVEISGGPLGSSAKVLAYGWDAANQVTRRYWNGELQTFEYDPSGQILKVWLYKTEDPNYLPKQGEKGELAEAYTYDRAGNITEQFVRGQKAQMTYNAGNQLTERIELADNGKTPHSKMDFAYDAGGRMTTLAEGKTGSYGWLDKLVTFNTSNGQVGYDYYPDGQLAEKHTTGMREKYLWDDLALLAKNEEFFTIEPHVNGGTPVASGATQADLEELTFYINDLLGTTLARVVGKRFEPTPVSTFGKPLNKPLDGASPSSIQVSTNQTSPQFNANN